MKVEFITETDNGAKWYYVDGQEVGLTEDGVLMDDQGCVFDCVDAESVAQRESIIDAINEFESQQ